jgi:3-hydroxybutyryl-CoA dehydrogenase
MKKIGVCGAGTMGSGIAQVCAAAGYTTILYDVDPAMLQKSASKMEQDLTMLVNKQKMTEEKKTALQHRLMFTSDINELTADVVIEAIVEKMDIKISLFKMLSQINGSNTIFASNTSSLSITSIASCLPDPGKFAGLHFFNPAPLMKLVEVVKGSSTAAEVTDQLVSFTKSLGKIPVVCTDSPGFIVNRVARPFYIESLRLLEHGAYDIDTIDTLLENAGFRMGPFRLMDLIGNDVNYAVSCSVYEQLHFPERLKPSYIQKDKVEQGALGKKTGKGYYNYESGRK